jgi:tyrosyl-tRNA synthetase
LFNKNPGALSVEDRLNSLADVPSSSVTMQQLEEKPLVQWLVETNLASSRSEATRLILGGGIYVNDVAEKDPKRKLTADDVWEKVLVVLGKGRRQKHVLKVQP